MAELVDTVLTVAVALVGWIVFLATVAAILVTAAAVTGAWAVRGAWRWLRKHVGPSGEVPKGPRRGLGGPVASREGAHAPGFISCEIEPQRGAQAIPRWAVGGTRR